MKITSTAFENNERIPVKYTCNGDDISPPLDITEAPERTNSFVIIVDDPDAPGETWIHWIVFNIPSNPPLADGKASLKVEEGESPRGWKGQNSWGNTEYGGPCPPKGIHRYFFKAYALDSMLFVSEGSTKEQIEKAMEAHTLKKAELIGLYGRD